MLLDKRGGIVDGGGWWLLVMLFWAKKDVVCWFVAVGSSSSSSSRPGGKGGQVGEQGSPSLKGTVYPPVCPRLPPSSSQQRPPVLVRTLTSTAGLPGGPHARRVALGSESGTSPNRRQRLAHVDAARAEGRWQRGWKNQSRGTLDLPPLRPDQAALRLASMYPRWPVNNASRVP